MAFTAQVTRLAVGAVDVSIQVKDLATGQIKRLELTGANFTDNTVTTGKRAQADMFFSILREALINKINVSIDPVPGFDTVLRSVTLGGPFS